MTSPTMFSTAPAAGRVRSSTPNPRTNALLDRTAPKAKRANAASSDLQLCSLVQFAKASQPVTPQIHAAVPGKLQNRRVIMSGIATGGGISRAYGVTGGTGVRQADASLVRELGESRAADHFLVHSSVALLTRTGLSLLETYAE